MRKLLLILRNLRLNRLYDTGERWYGGIERYFPVLLPAATGLLACERYVVGLF